MAISYFKSWEEGKLHHIELLAQRTCYIGPTAEDCLSMHFLKNLIFIRLFQ